MHQKERREKMDKKEMLQAMQNEYRPCKRCKPEKYYKTTAGGNENGERNSII